jgi:hypothetical protein
MFALLTFDAAATFKHPRHGDGVYRFPRRRHLPPWLKFGQWQQLSIVSEHVKVPTFKPYQCSRFLLLTPLPLLSTRTMVMVFTAFHAAATFPQHHGLVMVPHRLSRDVESLRRWPKSVNFNFGLGETLNMIGLRRLFFRRGLTIQVFDFPENVGCVSANIATLAATNNQKDVGSNSAPCRMTEGIAGSLPFGKFTGRI